MVRQGRESEGEAAGPAHVPRGYPQGLLGHASPSQAPGRQAIPSRYPAALREIIVGQALSSQDPPDVADEGEGIPVSPATLSGAPSQPACNGSPTGPRTGTFAVVSDELREVTGAITEGVGLFVKLPLFIARAMKSRQAQASSSAESQVDVVPLLDLDQAARTLESSPSVARSVSGGIPDEPDVGVNLPVVYADLEAGASGLEGPSDVDSLPSVMTGSGASHGRAICVASVTAVFKSCRFIGQAAKFTVVDAPRFVTGVLREAAEASRPSIADAQGDELGEAGPILSPPEIEHVESPIAIAAPAAVVDDAVVDVAPILPPQEPETHAEDAASDEAAAEVRDAESLSIDQAPEAETPSVAAPDIAAMVQAAVEAYAADMKQAAQEAVAETPAVAKPDEQEAPAPQHKPEVKPDDTLETPQALAGDESLDIAAELSPAATTAKPKKPELRPVIPSVANDWPVAPAIRSHLEEHQKEGSTWAEGIFYAGLGTLLITVLGSSLMFSLGFAINFFTQGFVSLLGVLLMVGGIGGAMIAVMLLNEWLSALRFQLSAAVRLLVRSAGILAAVALLLAFVATAIPREHWPI